MASKFAMKGIRCIFSCRRSLLKCLEEAEVMATAVVSYVNDPFVKVARNSLYS